MIENHFNLIDSVLIFFAEIFKIFFFEFFYLINK